MYRQQWKKYHMRDDDAINYTTQYPNPDPNHPCTLCRTHNQVTEFKIYKHEKL